MIAQTAFGLLLQVLWRSCCAVGLVQASASIPASNAEVWRPEQ
jgi:hypothetical protein